MSGAWRILLIASRLWDSWAPMSTREIVARALDGDRYACAVAIFVFLAGVHIGKRPRPPSRVMTVFPAGGEGSILWKPEHAGYGNPT